MSKRTESAPSMLPEPAIGLKLDDGGINNRRLPPTRIGGEHVSASCNTAGELSVPRMKVTGDVLWPEPIGPLNETLRPSESSSPE